MIVIVIVIGSVKLFFVVVFAIVIDWDRRDSLVVVVAWPMVVAHESVSISSCEDNMGDDAELERMLDYTDL